MSGQKLDYRLSPLAECDLEEIWLYTFRHWSLEQAEDQNIIRAIEALACNRSAWQKSNALPGYWKYPVGRHVIFFRNPEGFLDVIRILHEKMDVPLHVDTN